MGVVIDKEIQMDLQDVKSLEVLEDVNASFFEFAYPSLDTGM
jgi:hypothetical protein